MTLLYVNLKVIITFKLKMAAHKLSLNESQTVHFRYLKEKDKRYSVYSLSRDNVVRCNLCMLELNYYNGVYGYNRHLDSKRHHDSKQLHVIK